MLAVVLTAELQLLVLLAAEIVACEDLRLAAHLVTTAGVHTYEFLHFCLTVCGGRWWCCHLPDEIGEFAITHVHKCLLYFHCAQQTASRRVRRQDVALFSSI